MKKLSNFLMIFLVSSSLQAQQYHTAIGFRGDLSTIDNGLAELSLKHFFAGQSAFQINGGGNTRSLFLQVAYHRNQSLTSDIEWYWGAGVNGSYWKRGNYGRSDIQETTGFWGGIDGTVGLDYTFLEVPINLALDTGPTLRIVPEVKFGWMAGVSFRYAFR